MSQNLILLIAKSLYFSDANIMFGWQGWAYRQATEWRRLHDSWETMLDDQKSVWLEKAKLILFDIQNNDNDLYEAMTNGCIDASGHRWWI